MRDHMLLVVDVDNTIYDWVTIWAGAFSAAVRALTEHSDRTEDYWIRAAQAVHVRRAATECPSMLCDLASAPGWPEHLDAASLLPVAAAAYRNHWDHHLTTYPGIRESLVELSSLGHVVVAYTEGDVSIAATRLARLGLAGTIRRVFGRPPLPAAPQPSWSLVSVLRNGPITVDFIPREDSKPNPMGLRTIIAMCDASPQSTVYVGDNLYKDVLMARTLGAAAVWARYGAKRERDHQVLLERVAHWTAQAVASERSIAMDSVVPDAVADDGRELSAAVRRLSTTVVTC
jgi:phosphoglycolate phosphatase